MASARERSSVVARDERLRHLGRGIRVDEEDRATAALDAGHRHLVAARPREGEAQRGRLVGAREDQPDALRRVDDRTREAQTLGFKKLIIPASNKTGLEKLLGTRVVGVKNLEEALDELF